MANVGMIIGQLARLVGNGIRNICAAITDINAIRTREGIQHPGAVAVFGVTPRPAGDDAVRDVATGKVRQMGGRVKEILTVPLFKLVVV